MSTGKPFTWWTYMQLPSSILVATSLCHMKCVEFEFVCVCLSYQMWNAAGVKYLVRVWDACHVLFLVLPRIVFFFFFLLHIVLLSLPAFPVCLSLCDGSLNQGGDIGNVVKSLITLPRTMNTFSCSCWHRNEWRTLWNQLQEWHFPYIISVCTQMSSSTVSVSAFQHRYNHGKSWKMSNATKKFGKVALK